MQIEYITTKELKKLYNKTKWLYDHEARPLYKRIYGGRLITILEELQRRNE